MRNNNRHNKKDSEDIIETTLTLVSFVLALLIISGVLPVLFN